MPNRSPAVGVDGLASTLAPEADLAYGVLCMVLGLSATSCNLAVILMFTLRRAKLSPAEYFLLNLMVTSLLFIVISSPMVTASAFQHRWLFGELGGVIHGFLCYFCGILNILSIFLVALIRYLKTCWPHLGHLHDLGSARLYMAGAYVYALFWSVMPMVGWGRYGLEPHKISSSLDWTSPLIRDRTYVVSSVVFVFLLPLAGMLTFYCRIVLMSSRSTRAITEHGGLLVRELRRRDRKLNQLVVLVLAGFVTAWLPYTVVSLHASVVGSYQLPVWMVAVVTLFAKLSSLTNPLCYILVSTRYRTIDAARTDIAPLFWEDERYGADIAPLFWEDERCGADIAPLFWEDERALRSGRAKSAGDSVASQSGELDVASLRISTATARATEGVVRETLV
ncbi:opsin-5-like [Pollicipes pollicipes]|uniref:opsin-5-like n=1 Tax=Pollicipes pollicipes TaxID=41117 RepID=UPI00188574EF|nr:opsin-5-like [Pollicipes pollicipes]